MTAPSTAACTKVKVQTKVLHRESRVFSGVPRTMGFGLLRMIPGGLTELSTADRPSRLCAHACWHTFYAKPPRRAS